MQEDTLPIDYQTPADIQAPPSGKPSENIPPVPKSPRKKKKGSRTVTLIFYTVYVLLILSFLGGLYLVNTRLTELLTDYEASHISVACGKVFSDIFADPDWAAIYEQAGLEDTAFEGVNAYVSAMEAKVGTGELTYEETDSDHPNSHRYLVQLGEEILGSFTLSDQRLPQAQWPDWQLTGLTMEMPREITVQILKQDNHTAAVNGIALNDSHTIRIDTTLAEAYLPAGTDGDSMHLQQVTGLMWEPEITITDEAGNTFPALWNSETGIYEEQLPAPEVITAEEEALALDTAEAYCAYKLRNASEGYLSLYFKSTEQAYKDTVNSGFWTQTPGGYTLENQQILESRRHGDDLFSARISMTAKITGTEEAHTLDATFFFEKKQNVWTCCAVAHGNTYAPVTKVRLDFMVEDAGVYYDFYDTSLLQLPVPIVSAPDGYAFTGWASSDSAVILVPDETGYVTLPAESVLKPMVLYAVFEQTEGGN